jgi:hypothetical protein
MAPHACDDSSSSVRSPAQIQWSMAGLSRTSVDDGACGRRRTAGGVGQGTLPSRPSGDRRGGVSPRMRLLAGVAGMVGSVLLTTVAVGLLVVSTSAAGPVAAAEATTASSPGGGTSGTTTTTSENSSTSPSERFSSDALLAAVSTLVGAVVGGVVGGGVGVVLQGRRDLRAVRRIVASELLANAWVLETLIHLEREVPGAQVEDAAYRTGAITLARGLPWDLWQEIQRAYSQVPALKAGVAAPDVRPIVMALSQRMSDLGGRLEGLERPRWRWWRR